MNERFDRVYGGLLGLAVGDAISYPAAIHRGLALPEWQRRFQRRTNLETLSHRILRLMVPFGFGHHDEALLPGPTDDTEFAVLTGRVLAQCDGRPGQEDFVRAWHGYLVDRSDYVWTGFSERAAIENLRRGLRPPATGNDNPQFYDDSAVARSVPIGLACPGDPVRASELALIDSSISHAEEGVWAAQVMAAAIAVAADGGSLDDALSAGRDRMPQDSWIAWVDQQTRQLAKKVDQPAELALALSQQVITRTYSYANAAPETLPAAFALVEATRGDFWQGILLANTCARAADSLPAMVGALAGTIQGAGAIPPRWQDAVRIVRGICIPDLAGFDLHDLAMRLTNLGSRIS